MSDTKTIWLLFSAYNEEAKLIDFLDNSYKVLKKFTEKYRFPQFIIAVIDDGSQDRTWEIIKDFHSKYQSVIGIRLIKNVGQHKAGFFLISHIHPHDDDIVFMTHCDVKLTGQILSESLLFIERHGIVWIKEKKPIFKKILSFLFFLLLKMIYNLPPLDSVVLIGTKGNDFKKIKDCKNKNFITLCIASTLKTGKIIETKINYFKRKSRFTIWKKISLALNIFIPIKKDFVITDSMVKEIVKERVST